uniref:Uncharacterized protein n=1 Tax=Arundo donax TaxID=35708 RepID=A0A0A9GZ31_ARUDO
MYESSTSCLPGTTASSVIPCSQLSSRSASFLSKSCSENKSHFLVSRYSKRLLGSFLLVLLISRMSWENLRCLILACKPR